MNKIFATLILLFLICCSKDPLDKPIYEPLPVEVIKKQLDKNPDFELMFEVIEKMQNSDINTNVFKAKWSEITYNRLLEYRDVVSFLQLEENQLKFESEWNYKYGIGIRKTDSVIAYWDNYEVKNDKDAYWFRNKELVMSDEVRNYYNSSNNKQLYRGKIIESYYNNFISLNKYKEKKINEYLEEEDPLMHSFIESTKHIR